MGHGLVVSRLATAVDGETFLWDSGVPCSKLTSISQNSSLIIAFTMLHMNGVMSPTYKIWPYILINIPVYDLFHTQLWFSASDWFATLWEWWFVKLSPICLDGWMFTLPTNVIACLNHRYFHIITSGFAFGMHLRINLQITTFCVFLRCNDSQQNIECFLNCYTNDFGKNLNFVTQMILWQTTTVTRSQMSRPSQLWSSRM